MTKNILKKLFITLSLAIFLSPLISHAENKLFANTYEESEILKKREKYNAAPSTLSEEVFSKVSNTMKSPYNSVGTVFIKGETIASGVLIGKNTIITNYHVSRMAKKDPTKVIFTPGSTKTEDGVYKTPYGQFVAEEINEHPYGQGTDLSIIKLKPNKDGKSAGDLIPPAKIADSIDLQQGDKISLLGYPYNFSTNSLYRSEIEIFNLNSGQYFGYTESGNSGSGLFNLKGELVGIHVGKGGKYNLPIGKFFNAEIGSLYSVDNSLSTLGSDLKKRAELQSH
ncbi:TPA: exfoliative toxin D [Staphylococcus aureus]|nr:exfoliative toxin D [Staphylococcus aureus]HDJ2941098.1 exfoliative toxin D [Staphylococcus aureus]HDJ3110745.1 exfoliative toxin D [Staphylococcus aureus]HDJ3116128.1 exfoliative toxin D [Staphylococcus aureus]HDJ3128185.1 exfoliative toxin D [Staphylococcus aureus]